VIGRTQEISRVRKTRWRDLNRGSKQRVIVAHRRIPVTMICNSVRDLKARGIELTSIAMSRIPPAFS
jgi:hypothetical protein